MSKVTRPWIFILILHLLSVFVFLIQISSGAYVEQFLESVEVCTSAAVGPFSSLTKKKIRLANYPNNTVVVKLTRWDQFWPSFMNFRCKFQVTAPKKSGVMVVIQAMHLRTKKPSGVLCKDFIKFEQDDGFKTGQICGEISESDRSRSPDNLIGQRYFYDNKGAMDVSFSTGDKDSDETDKPLFLKMIFTAYSECSGMEVAIGKQSRCSRLRSMSCIPSTLRCDGEINCGFNDADFGTDEENCDGSSSRNGKSTDDFFSHDRPASLYVFAITCVVTLIVVVALVIVACCCIRRFANLRGHHPSNPHLSPAHDILEFHMATTNMSGSSAHISSPERNEKLPEDLPPPYDALFPQTEPMKKQ